MKPYIKQSFFFVISIILIQSSFAQENEDKSIAIETAFDFWIGDWEVHWMNPDSSYTYGHNLIEKTLDGKVIQENFVDSSSGFKGTSISVYSIADSTWHQSWADNSGGYFEFFGIIEGEKRMFQTKAIMRSGVMTTQRMVFYNISENSFTWDWESTQDDGATWNLAWRIIYERKQVESQ